MADRFRTEGGKREKVLSTTWSAVGTSDDDERTFPASPFVVGLRLRGMLYKYTTKTFESLRQPGPPHSCRFHYPPRVTLFYQMNISKQNLFLYYPLLL